MNPLEDWLARCSAALGVAWAQDDRDALLDLTKDVAHEVARPAAPLTAYLVGLAVAEGMSLTQAVEAVRQALPAGTEPGAQESGARQPRG